MVNGTENHIIEYIKNIYKNNEKDFMEFYESVDFNKIKDDNAKKDIFYFVLFQYSVKSYDELDDFYNDFETFIDAIEEEDYLKNIPEFYPTILNNYFDKLKNYLFNKYDDEKSYHLIKKILKKLSEIYIPNSKIKDLLIDEINELKKILQNKNNKKNIEKKIEKYLEILNKTLEKIEINPKNQISKDDDKIINDFVKMPKISGKEFLEENKIDENDVNLKEFNIENSNQQKIMYNKNDNLNGNIEPNNINNNLNQKNEVFDFVDNIAEKYFFNVCQETQKNNKNSNVEMKMNISNNKSQNIKFNNNSLLSNIDTNNFSSFIPKKFNANNMAMIMNYNNFGNNMIQQKNGSMPNQMNQFNNFYPQMNHANKVYQMKPSSNKK